MEQKKVFIDKVQKLLFLKSREETEEFINRLTFFLNRNKHEIKGITSILLGRGIAHIMGNIREYEVVESSHKILKEVRHICVFKHYEKIKELVDIGWGSQKIVNYLINILKCEKISRPTIQKVINLVKEVEFNKEISEYNKKIGSKNG